MLGILYGSVGPSFSFLVSFLSRPNYLWGEGHGNPLQYSCLENPMDRGTWQAIIYGVARVYGHD